LYWTGADSNGNIMAFQLYDDAVASDANGVASPVFRGYGPLPPDAVATGLPHESH
jgi:hypothetical protein